MRRVVLLMTTNTYRASAFLSAAQGLSVPVTVGSERTQALSGFNRDGHLTLDFSQPAQASRAIVEFAERTPVGAVVAADDEGAVLAAMASTALGLPTSAVLAVAAARDKLRTREVLARHGLLGPRFHAATIDDDPNEIAASVGFPCVVKPLSLSASRGVIRADDPAGLAAAVRRVASILESDPSARTALGRRILVEDYIPGGEVALEGLLAAGRWRTLALFDKPDPLVGPFFEETLYVTPSRLPAETQTAIVETTERAVRALGLSEGPIHAELRLNSRGAWVLEIAPRSIGGLCSRALRFGTGVTLEELILRRALGLPGDDLERGAAASGVMMIPIPKAGILKGMSGLSQARAVPGVEDVAMTTLVGERLVPLPEGAKYLGFIFARAEAPEQVEEALREANRRLHFEIEPLPATGPGAAEMTTPTRGLLTW